MIVISNRAIAALLWFLNGFAIQLLWWSRTLVKKKRVCLLNNSEIKLHCAAKMTAFVLCLCIFVGSEVCRLLWALRMRSSELNPGSGAMDETLHHSTCPYFLRLWSTTHHATTSGTKERLTSGGQLIHQNKATEWEPLCWDGSGKWFSACSPHTWL